MDAWNLEPWLLDCKAEFMLSTLRKLRISSRKKRTQDWRYYEQAVCCENYRGGLDPWVFSTSWGCWKTPPPSTTPGQLWIHGVPDSESRTFSGDKVPKLISDQPRPDGFVLKISQNDQTFVVPLLLGTPRWGMAPHFQHFGLDQVSFDLGCRRLSRLSGKVLEQLSGWRGSRLFGWDGHSGALTAAWTTKKIGRLIKDSSKRLWIACGLAHFWPGTHFLVYRIYRITFFLTIWTCWDFIVQVTPAFWMVPLASIL